MSQRLRSGRLHPERLLPLAIGLGVLAAGTAAGWDARLILAIATPPPLVRAAMLAGSVVLGVALLSRALGRLADADPDGARERDLVSLTRGVRLAFLAVAAFSAAGGWAIGHPLPIVIGLVIAGVDVLETSFLLLVIATRQATEAPNDQNPHVGRLKRGSCTRSAPATPPSQGLQPEVTHATGRMERQAGAPVRAHQGLVQGPRRLHGRG